jgi:beta-fructofuranosidase
MLTCFKMNPDIEYQNRIIQKSENGLLFDGYSVWLSGDKKKLQHTEAFTLEFEFAPYGISSEGDAIFSCMDQRSGEGMALRLIQDKKAEVLLGFGGRQMRFVSVNQPIVMGKWNHVFIIYRFKEGWCDLVVNGVLSNRLQFGRFQKISWPDRSVFLGKDADKEVLSPQMGVFWGWMRKAEFLPEAMPLEQALVCSSVGSLDEVPAYFPDRNRFEGDVNRPQYHLIEPEKWMNEPHAPFYYNGFYHIFYQANLHAPVWDFIQWGHLVSKDMVHWKDLPLALQSEAGFYDELGCWSGSGLVDREGVPRIYYTAGNNRCFPNQAVALAQPENALEDVVLKKWKKYPSLIKEQDIGWLGEFRDPFVWMEQDTYFMLVGTGDEHNGGGNAALYVSEDGIKWESCGMLVDYDYEINQEGGHVWELPELLPLRDPSGTIVCHIMMFCACQIEHDVVEVYYFLGNWNADTRKFTRVTDRLQLFDLGHGTFTGPSGFVTPDNRSVVFTIAQGKRTFADEYHAGWAHNGGLPLQLWWDNGLRMQPIREILSCKEQLLLDRTDCTIEQLNAELDAIHSNRMYLKLSTDADEIVICTESVANVHKSVSVVYNRKTKRFLAFDSEGKEISRFRGSDDLVEIKGRIEIEYFLDHSMIEVYLKQKKAMTLRNYVTSGERKISLKGCNALKCDVQLWQMEGAYDEECSFWRV